MIKTSKYHRLLLAILTLSLLSIAPAEARNRSAYGAKDLTFKEVKMQKDGTVHITFRAMPETVYYCPGVNVKTTKKGVELTFVRSWFRRKPKVDYAAKGVQGGVLKVVSVPTKGGAVFVKDGAKLVRLHPK